MDRPAVIMLGFMARLEGVERSGRKTALCTAAPAPLRAAGAALARARRRCLREPPASAGGAGTLPPPPISFSPGMIS